MVFEKIVQLLREYKDGEAEITRDTTFAQLGLDSLDRVELVMSFETEFDISLELNENMTTVGAVADAVEAELAKKGARA